MVEAEVICGDVIDVLSAYSEGAFTATFSDPPYGLKFMGKRWDHGVPGVPYWAEVLRVSKPGAVLLAFGGTRTYHRLACAIEDAGYELGDCLMWLYGSGFPKSLSIGKAIDRAAGAERKVVGSYRAAVKSGVTGGNIGNYHEATGEQTIAKITLPATPDAATWDGWGTGLKPAYEPLVMARKPRGGTYAQCAIEHGSGALWIDGGRIEGSVDNGRDFDTNPLIAGRSGNKIYGAATVRDYHPAPAGRWPANLILDPTSAAMLGEQSGVSKDSVHVRKRAGTNKGGGNALGSFANGADDLSGHTDTGTAARFFYCAKAARGERDAGLDELALSGGHLASREGGGGGWAKDGAKNPNYPRHNPHPTVKPLDLCRYYATLIRPPEAYLDG